MRWIRRLLLGILPVFIAAGAVSPLFSQGETIVTISAQSWMGDIFSDRLFEKFTADHPGVKVVFVPASNDSYYPPAAFEEEKHFEGAQKYVASADVLFVGGYNLSVEDTRAGYFLDLAPFVKTDSAINTDDFFPAIWQSVQWDGGTWMIPVSGSVQILTYNKQAFDDAGLAYPDETWTFDDLANAARKLTVRNEKGDVQIPGMNFYSNALLRAFLGAPLYDSSAVPFAPDFSNPELAPLLEKWLALQKELSTTGGNYDYDKIPLTLDSAWRLTSPNPDQKGQWAGALLPGGVAGLDVQGFAVSGGTQSPELAYALAVYMSQQPEVIDRIFGTTPARKSMVGVKPENSMIIRPKVPADVQALLDQALEHALPATETLFFDYVNQAVGKAEEDKSDLTAALQTAEADAKKKLEAAAARRTKEMLLVSTPVPTPSFDSGKIVLNFGLNLYSGDIPNKGGWDRLVADFLASNSQVGNIDIKTQFFSQEDLDKTDCYIYPTNIIPDADLATLQNLEPYMSADPDFDSSDLMPGILPQLQRDNKTWGYPLVIYPSILLYNSDQFKKANVPEPENGWLIESFKDAVTSLKPIAAESNTTPFVPQGFDDTYLLMLAAAYGGVPYDYRTNPPTVDLTNPKNVEALRQVLDLAKDKLIGYQELAKNGGSVYFNNNAPIYSDTLSTNSFQMQMRGQDTGQTPLHVVNFPAGRDLLPLAYSIGTAYINAKSQNPEACYQWISSVAKHPNLLSGIPARQSQLGDPAVVADQGPDVTALYQHYASMMTDPKAVYFPGQYGGGPGGYNSYIEKTWMNKAFDHYVLENGDLEADLADAQKNIEAFRVCADTIPKLSPAELDTPEKALAYSRQFADCAVSVDPSMKSNFGYLYEEQQ
jgi:ABC-type glycerol-3-phosphate transport system substrate-binding protein